MWFNPNEVSKEKELEETKHKESTAEKLRDIKSYSMDNRDAAENLCGYIFCGTACTVTSIILCIMIPVANIFIGVMYMYDCPRQYMIPVYLMVSGAVILFRSVITMIELYLKQRSDLPPVPPGHLPPKTGRRMVFKVFDTLNGIFLFAWFIAGNVWVFGIHQDHQEIDMNQESYCAPVLYNYAFWGALMIFYIIALAALVILLLIAAVVCGLIGSSDLISKAVQRAGQKPENTEQSMQTDMSGVV